MLVVKQLDQEIIQQFQNKDQNQSANKRNSKRCHNNESRANDLSNLNLILDTKEPLNQINQESQENYIDSSYIRTSSEYQHTQSVNDQKRKKNDTLFKTQKDVDQEIKETKINLLASISHGIKTPLNSATMMVQCLSNLPQIDKELYDQYIYPIHCSTQILNSIVNDFTDLVHMETQKYMLGITQFDIKELINQTILLFVPDCSQKKIKIQTEFLIDNGLNDSNDTCDIYSDMNRIKQILFNLITNSIKYSEKGDILIRLTQDDDKKHYNITIIDQGCGISKDTISRIEGVTFKRSKSNIKLNPENRGIGIGLTFCQAVCKTLNKQNLGLQIKSSIEKQKQGTEITVKIFNHIEEKDKCQKRKILLIPNQFIEELIENNSFEQTTPPSQNTGSKNQSIKQNTGSRYNGRSIAFFQQNVQYNRYNQQGFKFNPISEKKNLGYKNSLSSPNQFPNQSLFVMSNKKTLTSQIVHSNTDQIPYFFGQQTNQGLLYENQPPPILEKQASSQIQTDSNNQEREKQDSKKTSISEVKKIRLHMLGALKEDNESHYQKLQNEQQKRNHFIQELQEIHKKTGSILTQQSGLGSMYFQSNYNTEKIDPEQTYIQSPTDFEQINAVQDFKSRINLKQIQKQQIQSQNSIKNQSLYFSQTSLQNQIQQQIPQNQTLTPGSQQQISIKQVKKHSISNNFNESQQNSQKNVKVITNSVSPKSKKRQIQNQGCICPQILVVDDDIFNLNAVTMILANKYKELVDKATNGLQALQLVKNRFENNSLCCQNYKLIIMDMDMPIMNGKDACTQIYKFYEMQNTKNEDRPFICSHTAYSDKQMLQEMQNNNLITHNLSKPFAIQELDELINDTQQKNLKLQSQGTIRIKQISNIQQ